MELLGSIKSLFGNQVLSSLDSIRCVFSRDDALRLPIENDDDIKKVIAIAETNRATKLNFLLTRKKDSSGSRITAAKTSNDDSISISDDGHQADLHDGSIDSPPPGTVASYKRRTTTSTSTKSTASSDGGLFIPESVNYLCFQKRDNFYHRESL